MQAPRLLCRSSQRVGWAAVARRGLASATGAAGIPSSVPVVIIGGGTVGRSLSLMLSRFGVECLVVDRNHVMLQATSDASDTATPSTPPPHPRAHVLHTRTMEILRELGLEEEVHKTAPPLSQWRHFRYLESMLGEELGVVDFFKGPTARWLRAASPATLSHLSQPTLDTIFSTAIRRGPSPPATRAPIHTLSGFSGDSFEILSDHGRVRVSLESIGDGKEAVSENTREVECEYLVGCDGANSAIRRGLGVELSGEAGLQHFISVHFTCRDLWPRLRELRRPGMLHFIFNRKVVGVLVAHNFEKGHWVAQFPFYPPHQTPEDVTDIEVCETMIRDCLGGESGEGEVMEITMHSADAWVMNGLVADSFSDPSHRVFLCGDSAHQFPPSGGFGLNAGIQDAHNLAWKLATALNGGASSDLLSSYTPERKQVCEALRDLSIDNFHRGLLVPEALGLPPQIPGLVSEALDSEAARVLTPFAKKTILETALGFGRAFNPNLSPPGLTVFRGETLSRFQRILDRFESLPLLFPRHDLGLEYTAPGSLASGSVAPGKSRVVEGVEQYQPRLAPGARLPHFWLTSTPTPPSPRTTESTAKINEEAADTCQPTSSLDLITRLSTPPSPGTAASTPRWVLLLDDDEKLTVSSPELLRDLALAAARIRCPAAAAAVGDQAGVLSRIGRVARRMLEQQRDHKEGHHDTTTAGLAIEDMWDAEGGWQALVRTAGGGGLGTGFCVLVRPDGVVAWCGTGGIEAGIAVTRQLQHGTACEEGVGTAQGSAG